MDSSTPFIQSGLASSLRQPATIAAIASVGIHALFAVNIEKISLFTPGAQLPPSVELVELSADQVGGIYPPPPPQFGLSEFTPPPSLSSILGGGPTVPAFPSSPPPPSSPTFTTPQQELFTIPVNPSVGSRGSGLPSYPESYPSYPDNYSFGTLPPSTNIPTYTPPPAPSIPDQNTFPDKNSEELDRAREFYEQLQRGEIVFSEGPDPLGQSGIFNPNTNSDDEPGSEPPRFPQKGPTDDMASANVDQETPSQTPPEEFRGSILANLEEGLDQEENTDVAANSQGNEPVFQQQQPEEQPQGQLSNQQRAMLEGGSLYVNWVLGVQQSYPDVQGSQVVSISDVYPSEACEQQLSGRALVGVVVGSGGEILAGPELLLDTGSGVLDNTAVQTVREFVTSQASGGGTPTAYQYAFNFNSENCGDVSSPEQVPPQVTPGNSQPAQNNSTPGATTESEDSTENSVVTPPEDISETQPEMEPEALQPETTPEPSEAFTETETETLEVEPEVSQPEAVGEPTEMEPEVTQPDAVVEPPLEMEPEVTQPDAIVEPSLEMEPEVTQPEAIGEPTEMEPEVTQPEAVSEPTEMEPEVTQPEAMPSEFDQPLENMTPAESEELIN
ncbi:MAG: hypothetical protein WBB43_19135 [Limnoraphis sp.]